MRRITKHNIQNLRSRADQWVLDAMEQATLILKNANVREGDRNKLLTEMRISLGDVLHNNLDACQHRNRPEELTYVENLLTVRNEILYLCELLGVSHPESANLRVFIKRDFYQEFESIDSRRFTQYYKNVINGFLLDLVDDPEGLNGPVKDFGVDHTYLFTLPKNK